MEEKPESWDSWVWHTGLVLIKIWSWFEIGRVESCVVRSAGFWLVWTRKIWQSYLVEDSRQFLEDRVEVASYRLRGYPTRKVTTQSKHEITTLRIYECLLFMYLYVWICDHQLRPLRPSASVAGTFARQTGRAYSLAQAFESVLGPCALSFKINFGWWFRLPCPV